MTAQSSKPLYIDWGAMVFDRDAPFNLLVFERRRGKTFGLREQMLRDFISRGESHIAIARYKNEIHGIVNGYFDDVIAKTTDAKLREKLKHFDISYQGASVKIRRNDTGEKEQWQTLLTCIPLSKANAIKQEVFSNLRRVSFDEALIDTQLNPYTRYLPNEYAIFQNVVGTLERFESKRGIRFYLMGNAVDLTNPYFAALKIYSPAFGRQWYMRKTWLFVYPNPKDFDPLPPENSYAARLGSRTSDYGNIFSKSSRDFVANKTKGAKFAFGFVYKHEHFGVWADYDQGIYYIDEKIPTGTDAPVYALTADDNRPNMLVAKRANKVMQSLIELYCIGAIRYSSPHLRERFNAVAGLFGVR